MQFLCIMSEDSAGDEVNDPNYIVVNKIFFVYAHLFWLLQVGENV